MARDDTILTVKQRKFCERYVVDHNGTQAYMEIYNVEKRKNATLSAYKLIKKEKIRKFIDMISSFSTDVAIADKDELMKYWTAVKRGQIEEDVVIPSPTKPTVVKKKTSVANGIRASELLAKALGVFVEKTEVSTNATVNIIDDIPSNDVKQPSAIEEFDND